MARPELEIELTPSDTSAVEAQMDRLTRAGAGWINLLPGVQADDPSAGDEPGRPSPFAGLFGPAQSAVTMVTWVPATTGRRGTEMANVGIMHPRGRKAAQRLAEMGAPVPVGWQVRQDHARRGLIVHVPAAVPAGEVLDWALRAGELLAAAPLTGSWQARVYEPRRR